MFAQLTKYLVHYHNVSIPEVGSVKLQREPARHDVAEKLIYPPLYSIKFDRSENVKKHQLEYIAVESGSDLNAVEHKLQKLGKEFRTEVQLKSFSWNKIGLFTDRNATALSFQPTAIVIEVLQPIVANKVIRGNAQHTVLIGENEMLKGGILDEIIAPVKRKKYVLLIGWMLVLLAIAFIVFYLYSEGFQSLSSGTRIKAVSSGPSK